MPCLKSVPFFWSQPFGELEKCLWGFYGYSIRGLCYLHHQRTDQNYGICDRRLALFLAKILPQAATGAAPGELMQSLRFKGAEEQVSASAERPRKRVKLLLEDDSSSGSDSSDVSGGVALNDHPNFKVNEEYARRFEHNQKRAELHRRELSKLCT